MKSSHKVLLLSTNFKRYWYASTNCN